MKACVPLSLLVLVLSDEPIRPIGEASALCAHLATMALREQRLVRWDARNGKLL